MVLLSPALERFRSGHGGADVSRPTTFRVIEQRCSEPTNVFTVEIGPSCPYFEGHFPARAILPAIAQLELVRQLYRRTGPPTAWVAEIEHLRLSRAISPGEVVTVTLEAARGNGRTSFRIERSDGVISQGTLRWGEEVVR